MKHKRQQITAFDQATAILHTQEINFQDIFKQSGNSFQSWKTIITTDCQTFPSISQAFAIPQSQVLFYLTVFFSILFSWYFKLHEYWHQAKIHEGMHMHLRTTNAWVYMCIRQICAYARCECKPTEENKRRHGDQNGRLQTLRSNKVSELMYVYNRTIIFAHISSLYCYIVPTARDLCLFRRWWISRFFFTPFFVKVRG